MFRENVISPFGKVAIVAYIAFLLASSFANIVAGHAPYPLGFALSVFGFTLFAVAKSSVIQKRAWITFGTKHMSEGMASFYRFGYWFMIVGILLTFSGVLGK